MLYFCRFDTGMYFNLTRISIFFILGLSACSSPDRRSVDETEKQVELRYAEGFSITPVGNSMLVEVNYPYQGATEGYRYLLVPKEEEPSAVPHDAKIIRIPLDNIVVTSTTHVPMLDYLGETDKLVGFPTPDYISSARMRARIDEGEIVDLGVDKAMDIERLTALSPDMLMGYSVSADYGQFKKIEEMGIPVVINAEYLEKHPLGRAEWIKFVAQFFGKQDIADSVFARIEDEYLTTVSRVADVDEPSVLSGIVYGDAWFLPGGRNYAARLFGDAGYNYLWSSDSSTGYLQLSFESVYAQAHDADLWIGVGSFSSLSELEAAEGRYARFRPFQNGEVYNYNARIGAKGGNEYLELGYLRPDLILKDLVKIAHPELLPDHALYFHKKLN